MSGRNRIITLRPMGREEKPFDGVAAPALPPMVPRTVAAWRVHHGEQRLAAAWSGELTVAAKEAFGIPLGSRAWCYALGMEAQPGEDHAAAGPAAALVVRHLFEHHGADCVVTAVDAHAKAWLVHAAEDSGLHRRRLLPDGRWLLEITRDEFQRLA